MADERTFVIVGGGLAGAKAAESLRAEGFSGRILLVGAEPEPPYERPPLSKGYLLGKEEREKAFVHPIQWYRDNSVELMLSRRATQLEPAEHTVTLDDGQRVRYDRLLLATGASPRRIDLPGVDLTGVRYLRTFGESDALKATLTVGAGTRVLIIGAGWIGLEVAAAAREYGAEVTVVEVDSLPLRRVLGDEVATIFAELHTAHEVDLRFNSGVQRLTGTDGRLSGAVLKDGTELPADLVLVAVGVAPNVELAQSAGLAVDNGVLVDSGLCTSDPDIFACGDVANVDTPLLGRRIRVEHWANALNSGPAAGLAMLGKLTAYDRVPYFYTDQYELGMEYSGWVEPGGYDQVVFRGGRSVADGFIVFWVRQGWVLAGMNVNVWDVTDPIQALVRAGYAGRSVDLAKLADPDVPLDELLT